MTIRPKAREAIGLLQSILLSGEHFGPRAEQAVQDGLAELAVVMQTLEQIAAYDSLGLTGYQCQMLARAALEQMGGGTRKTSGEGDDLRGESHAGTRQSDSLNGPGGTLNPSPEPDSDSDAAGRSDG